MNEQFRKHNHAEHFGKSIRWYVASKTPDQQSNALSIGRAFTTGVVFVQPA
jgi:hypothetical protein